MVGIKLVQDAGFLPKFFALVEGESTRCAVVLLVPEVVQLILKVRRDDERDSAKGHQVRPEKNKMDFAISFFPVAS